MTRKLCLQLALFLAFLLPCADLASAAPATRSFRIPAGDAEATLREFSKQAGVQIIFDVDKVSGVKTAAVRGELTPRAALDQMFAGTRLVAAQDEKTGALTVRRENTDPNAERASPVAPPLKPARPDELVELDAYTVSVSIQKRPESVQNTPISITSLASRDLERFKIDDIRDLSRLTPNLLVSTFSPGTPTLAIRGATNTFNQIGVNKPVAVVIDDVFIPRNSAASFSLFDLDSLQVLRGPQGTLFGRNVTGGAIVFNTRLPSMERELEAQVDYGNFSDLRFQAMASGPLGGLFAAKVTLLQHTHNGYGRDRLTGREEDDLDSSGVRGQLLFKSSPQLKALLTVDYADDRNGGRTLSSKGLGNDGDRRTSELGYPQSFARTMWGLAGKIEWSPPAGDFASITAYRESQSADDYSGVGASYVFLTAGSQAVTRDLDHPGTFTQELRFASPKGQRADFVAGVYYLNEDGYRNLVTRAFAARTGATVTHQIANQKVESRSYAGYLDGVLHLGPALDLTLGGRYTADKKTASLVRTDLIAAAGSFSGFGLNKRWNEFTPRAVITWSPSKDARVYGSVTKGYTAGGFNVDAAVPAALSTPFDPETVTNYEAGVKVMLLERRLRLNAAVFRETYRDKQELYFNTLTRVLTIVNASTATMNGGELEAAFSPVPGLRLTGALGLLDAKYDTFVVPGVLNYTRNPLGSSPKHKVSLSGDYEYRLGKAGYVSVVAAWSQTASYYTGATKDPNLFVPAYALFNASLGFETIDRRWRVTLWGRNLGNTEYLLTPSTQTVLAEYLGAPRTYGVTLGMRY